MAQDFRNEVRSRTLRVLLDKVDTDQYPSSTMLDMVEQLLTPDDVVDYVEVLLSKVEDENYPSNSIIRRLMALA